MFREVRGNADKPNNVSAALGNIVPRQEFINPDRVFAFIGFDDVVNIVEETKKTKRTMPLAIHISLVFVTLIYFFVVFVAVQSLRNDELTQSDAPIRLLFKRLTGLSRRLHDAQTGQISPLFLQGKCALTGASECSNHRDSHNASRLTFVPLGALVEWTSQIILAAFILLKMSLISIKLRGDIASVAHFYRPSHLPNFGCHNMHVPARWLVSFNLIVNPHSKVNT